MPRRTIAALVASALLLALILPLGRWPATGAGAHAVATGTHADQTATSPSPDPVTSALVGLEGPSVFRRLAVVAAREVQAGAEAAGDPAGDAAGDRQATRDPGGDGGGEVQIDAAWIAARGLDARALAAQVRRRQEPVVRAARRLGITVISRYTTSANGLLVHATAGQLADLRAVPGVAFVEPAPIVRPLLAQSVPHIGAMRLAQERGYDGTGSYVAIIDTGVDYTHGQLGGPGTVEAYQAASRAGMTEVITDTWQGAPLFPTAKFVGGYDFVGPRYNPPHNCTPAVQAQTGCTSIPEPDSDPLDGAGHGTHVSGIVGGEAVATLADGVAPGARLVGLKLYGTGGADEAADVLVDSIEWCAGVNLGTETRGVIPPRVDAINISLGEVRAQGSRMFDEAVEAAVGSGIVIAASAGNEGNLPFILGVPSASPKVLSVASSVPPITVIDVVARWEDQQATYDGVASDLGRPLTETGTVTGELALYGLACNDEQNNPEPPAQDVREKIALVARGVCGFPDKLINAERAGAIAVVMYSDRPSKHGMGSQVAGIGIPAVMIDQQPGRDLRAKLEAGVHVDATIDPSHPRLDPSHADEISGFSSRGPSKNGALKPDITAPGTNIHSAALGSGSGGVVLGGTSMSSPHIAGAAALVHHRNRAEKLGLSGADLAALLMNYARPVVFTPGPDKTPVPVVRQGAGEVDLWRSGTGMLLVRAGDLASINLGPLALTTSARIERTLRVKNLGTEAMLFRVDAAFAFAEDRDQGVTIDVPDEPIAVAGKAETTVTLVFHVDPGALRDWTLRPNANAMTAAVNTLEIDGYVTVTPVDGAGNPWSDMPAASVPFYTLPRKASSIASRDLVQARGDDTLNWSNSSPFEGDVELFMLPTVADATGTLQPAPEDPDEPDVLHELDLRRVGVRYEPAAAPDAPQMLTFGVARHAVAAIPQNTRTEIYLDLDRDGMIDHRVRSGVPENEDGDPLLSNTMLTYYARWDAAAGTVITGTEHVTGTLHASDVHTHLSMLSVPLPALDLTEPVPFDFYVVHRGLNEDWLFQTTTDVAPDGAEADAGPRYHVDPGSLARVPYAWRVSVASFGEDEIALAPGPGLCPTAWLAFYPDNGFGGADGQMQALIPADSTCLARVYLPWAVWEVDGDG